MRTATFLFALAALASAVPIDQLPFTASPATTWCRLPSLEALNLPTEHLQQLQEHITSLPERRLVQLSDESPPVFVTEGEKALLVMEGRRFMDITDYKPAVTTQAKELYPSKLTYTSSFLEPLFAKIDLAVMKAFLTEFSAFRTRYYRSSTGKESQKFLLATLQSIAKTNKDVNVTFTEFEHPWGQNSIIARFEPAKWKMHEELSEKIVILGAHQDSTNLLPFLAAPGADDDGSGTTSQLMAFSVLVNSTFQPSSNPVEFHFYSAEEGGMLGSNAVAQAYSAAGKQVRAMLQLDMTAWVKAGTAPTVGLITDFVDPDLVELLRKLVTEYAEIGFTDTKCSYQCSDHSAWTSLGYPSSFAIESTFEDSNHNIHSGNDRIDYSPEFSFEHMAQFTRVALGLAVELGGGASLE